MSTGMPFGPWLKQHRKSLDLTQQDLALQVGCSLETVVKIESGERRPSKQVAERLAGCLSIPTEEYAAFVNFARAEPSSDQTKPPPGIGGAMPWHVTHHLQPLHSHPNNLPAQPNAFVGREKQVASAGKLLRRPGVRLLSMVGPPGVGKTRTSLRVAADMLDEFDNGVYFIALASISDPRLVVSTIAQTLGVLEAGHRALLDSLKNYLRDKQMLLVLDNFEQVIPAAPLVAELLAAAPQLKVLVTSRTVLRIYGEHELRLPSLALPPRPSPANAHDHQSLLDQLIQYEAVALFIERAQAADPDITLTGDNAQAIAEICRLLDGLPLAIELAAARIKFFSPEAMLGRLEGDGSGGAIKLLAGGPTNLPPRQRTMRGAIAWSYELLNAEEQKLFRKLSVFVGGCTPDAALAVCEVQSPKSKVQSPKSKVQESIVHPAFRIPHSAFHETQLSEVENVLDSFVDRSLLRQEGVGGWEGPNGGSRFSMLETIREYGWERLDEGGEAEAASRRHAHYYLSLAEQAEPEIRGSRQASWFDRLESEIGNLRAALLWAEKNGESETGLRIAGALGWFWFRRGHMSEGREWLKTALAMPNPSRQDLNETENPKFKIQNSKFKISVRAKALNAAGRLADHQGDYEAARDQYEQSRHIYEKLGDNRGVGYSLCGLAFTNYREGDHSHARQLYEQALGLFRELGDKRGIATSIRGLGDVALHEGDYDKARALYEESLALFQDLGDKYIIATLLNGLGNVALDQGDYDKSRILYEESLAIFRELEDKYGIAGSLLSLGEAARCQGDYEAACSLYEESLDIWKVLGEKWNMAMTLHNLGHAVHHLGDIGQAKAIFTESLYLFRDTGAKVGIAMCLAGLAGVAGASGGAHPDPERAATLFGASEALLEATGVPLQAADLADYTQNLAATRAQLDKPGFEEAQAKGHVMSLEQAVAYAVT